MMRSLVVAILLAAATQPLAAQPTPGRVDLGLSVGVFEDYPRHFIEPCTATWTGFSATATRWMARSLAVEGSATLTGTAGAIGCTDALFAPLPIDVPYERVVVDERIRGQSFFATNVGMVFDALPASNVSPRLRLVGGRLWDKGIWTWSYGAGLRFRMGESALIAGIEQWRMGYDVAVETRVARSDQSNELLATRTEREAPDPILFRVGWELRVR
jgi:hypothetical protein